MTILKNIRMDNRWFIEGYCDSTETKPTADIAEGSTLTEPDTGKVFMYNVRANAWIEQFSLQG